MINENDCEDEDEIMITFENCTGITSISDNFSLMIYPNPAKSVLNITLNGSSESVEYSLLNYQGQMVYSKTIGHLNGSAEDQIQLGEFTSGIYYLRLNTADDVIIRKIIIQ